MTLHLAIALLLGVDVAPPRPPVQADCRADSDCMISTFAGCCGACCTPSPFAVSRANDDAQRRRCAIVDCAAPRCDGARCAKQEPVTAFRAVCQRGACTAVRVTAGPGQCTADSDCRIDWVSEQRDCGPCGCCPGSATPIAVHVSTPMRPQPPPPRPLVKKEEKPPPFGLNQGGPQPQAPNCSPCPAPPPPPRAVCSVGRCTLQRGAILEE